MQRPSWSPDRWSRVIAQQVAFHRRRLGWSRAELARRVHVSRDTIVRLETYGARRPRLDLLGALATVFGISGVELIDADGAPAPARPSRRSGRAK